MGVPRNPADGPADARHHVDATGIATADRILPDFTLVASVSFTMTDRSSAAVDTWTTTITQQTVDVLVADRVLQQSDTASLRTLHAAIWATAAGAENPVFCGSFDLEIKEP